MYDEFLTTYLTTFDSCFPLKKIYSNNKLKSNYAPWLTTRLLKFIKQKHKLHIKSCRDNIFVNTYKHYNSTLKKLIKVAKPHHY